MSHHSPFLTAPSQAANLGSSPLRSPPGDAAEAGEAAQAR